MNGRVKNVFKYIIENERAGYLDRQIAVNLIKMLNTSETNSMKDIAIIGMSINMPMAQTLNDYWNNIRSGKRCIIKFPNNRKMDTDQYLTWSGMSKNKQKYIQGAFLNDIDKFDYEFFKLSPNEARLMDPGQRLFLETAWRAIEDAGYGIDKLSGSKTGIYVGYSTDLEYNYFRMVSEVEPSFTSMAMLGNIPSFIPRRLAYILNLKGPSMVVDTACSSSMVAVHLACKGISNGECDMAIAGGIRINLFPLQNKVRIGIESPSFETRTFDNSADGTAMGEGIVGLLLKPLDKALDDRDSIYAVIKGSAVNQDGVTGGITAPNVDSQTQVIVDAWKASKINPETISYIEVHGTGTKLGDSIEIEGINNAFEKFTNRKQFCAVSTLKTNMGHLYEASGIAGMVKAILSLKHKELPPLLNFTTPNYDINFEETAIYINDRLREWEVEDYPRRCGVSSFAISGTNCHLILEEAPQLPKKVICRESKYKVITLSAKKKEILKRLIVDYLKFLNMDESMDLDNICFTANTGRMHFDYRISLIIRNIDELKCKLNKLYKDKSLECTESDLSKGYFATDNVVNLTINEKRQMNFEANRKLKEYILGGKQEFDILSEVCKLYVKGANVDWNILYNNELHNRVNLPGYPFEDKRCWIKLDLNRERAGITKTNNKVDVRNVLPCHSNKEQIIISGDDFNLKLQIKKIWEEILGFEGINVNEDFYNLGGNSIIAMKILNVIHERLKINIKVSELLQHRTISDLALFLSEDFHKDNGKNVIPYSPIEKVSNSDYYPVSSAQKRMLVIDHLQNSGIAYNICTYLEIHGMIDIDRLSNAFKEIISRHEILRTSFDFVDGIPIQRVSKRLSIDIQCYTAKEHEFTKLMNRFIRPFDLKKLPLFRVGIIKISEDKHFLILDIHHIIFDGTSLGILMSELFSLYNGDNLPELKIQYKDFAAWQNNILQQPLLKKQESYWLKVFSGQIPLLNLPTDNPRPSNRSFKGDCYRFELENTLVEALKQFTVQTKTTLYMVSLATYNCLLWKLTGQEDIVVGTPTSGRIHKDLENLLGIFINTLAIRSKIEGNKKFIDFLKEVRKNVLLALEHQDYQFENLIENIDIQRDLSRNPLFDTMFILQDNSYIKEFNTDELTIIPHVFHNHSSVYDITFQAFEKDSDISFMIEYDCDLFERDTIEKFSKYFMNILKEVMRNPNVKIEDIEVLDKIEREHLLYDFNNTALNYAKEKTIQELFEQQVARTPKDTAVVFKNQTLTYKQLNEKSNQLARLLRNNGVGADNIVGIMVERSPEMLIGIIGVLKAGGAYLPIDPGYPVDRIQYMLEDSKTNILLTQQSLLDKIEFKGEIIDLFSSNAYAEMSITNLRILNNAQNLAYVIYTSGSTGKPKGVMLEHHSVNNFINGISNIINFTAGKIILNLTTISFDIFVLETLLPLCKGLKIIIADENEQIDAKLLNNLIIKNKVDMMQVTPSRLKLLMRGGSDLTCFKYLKDVMIGGEALPDELLHQLKQVYYGKIFNMYGPTEATVWSMVKELTDINEISIGKPISNTQIYIIDKNNKLQPIGVSGELCIGGDGVARGYLNRKDLTKEKFFNNPYKVNEKIYRTGDLAKWQPDGTVEFLGRIDNQVKIRGYRIELSEIEKSLGTCKGIKECVVISRENSTGDKYLIAYYVADMEIGVSKLREHMLKELPDYMIPSYFVPIKCMPLTPNGKIDKKALPEHDTGRNSLKIEYKAPTTQVEKQLVDIWEDVLEREEVGINDVFFELGGNSLLLVQMHTRIDKLYPGKVEVADIFAYPTISKLAQFISEDEVKGKKKLELKGIKFPEEYFINIDEENEDTILRFQIDEWIVEKIIKVLQNSKVRVEDVLLSIYIYMLHEMCEKDEVIVQVALDSINGIFPININVEDFTELGELVESIEQIRKQLKPSEIYEFGSIDIRVVTEQNLVIPLFTNRKDMIGKLIDVYDFIMKVEEEEDTMILIFEYNASKLRKSKVVEMSYAYIKLLKSIAMDTE